MRFITSFAPLIAGTLLMCRRHAQVLAWPDPEPFKGEIPHNDREITMDPALMRRGSDNKMFLFTTGVHQGVGSVWTAPSIRGPWTKSAANAFGESDHEPWNAPYVHYVDGVYYLYYSNQYNYVSEGGVQDAEAGKFWHASSLNVRSSKTMEPGSWKPRGRLPIPWARRYNILDGSVLTIGEEPDQKREHLLTFGSYQEGIFQLILADPPVTLAPNAGKHIMHLAQNMTSGGLAHPDPIEAGFIWWTGKWYYLFFSSGRCTREPDDSWASAGDAYKVMVCRSVYPQGGYVDKEGRDCLMESGGTLVLGSHGNVWAPGGQGVMILPEVGGPILYYHYGE
ncbi:hypothetical protein SLS62_008852 [Diatrype stigma]|uniref:Endo-1,5-alpha-L-arabinanase A n=1 Tax=Diatrype stigma TaxID=117547 RepID=A0AAN9YKR8_9PEZI